MSIKPKYTKISIRDEEIIRANKITIYKRVGQVSAVDNRFHQSDKWYVKITVAGEETIRRSLKTSSRNDAINIAEELYSELKYKNKHGYSLKSKRFSVVCESFLTHFIDEVEREKTLKPIQQKHTTALLRNKRLIIRNYIIPILGDKNLEDITDLDIEDFVSKRKVYWISGIGSKKGNITYLRGNKTVSRPISPSEKKEPSYGTINKELTVIRQIFEYSRLKRLINRKQIPTIKNLPKPKNRIDNKPSISPNEYLSLHKTLYWKIKKQNNPKHRRSHILLYYYILIMGKSGMRVSESKNLKFSNCSTFKKNGEQYFKIFVHGKGKSRPMIPLQKMENYINILKHFHKENAKLFGWKYTDDMYVFSNDKGKRINSFSRSLDNLFEQCGLLYAEDGKKRSGGCFRKYYMEKRLTMGQVNIYDLAKNTGTSVAVIEKFYSTIDSVNFPERLVKIHRKHNPITTSPFL